MTDTYVPSQLSGYGRSSSNTDDQLSTRIRLITSLNPYMGARPDAVQAMAMSDLSTDELVTNSGAMYGMQVGTSLADQLSGMSDATQRAIFSTLTVSQQQALSQIGYQTPERDSGGGILGTIGGGIAGALGVVSGGAMAIPGVSEIAHAGMEGLTWIGNWPGHLYRTIRLQETSAQVAGAVGAVVGGAAALAFAPHTGGGSLAVAGTLGLGALAGGSAASFLSSEISNPGDWMRAFDASWDGERTFLPGARKQADELLGDPKLSGLAQDMAALPGFSIDLLATELAGERDSGNINSQMKKIEELATRIGGLGTPEFQRAAQTMLTVSQDPTFQSAVRALQQGKISPGRDVANTLHLNPNSGLYSVVSGLTDAAFTIAVDPTLIVGEGMSLLRARRYGVEMLEGGLVADRAMAIFAKPAVQRIHDAAALAIETGDLALMKRAAPSMASEMTRLIEHKNMLKETNQLVGEFTAKQLDDYLIAGGTAAPFLRGVGSVRAADVYLAEHWTPVKGAAREVAKRARAFTDGMADVKMVRNLERLIDEVGETSLLGALPDSTQAFISDHGGLYKAQLYRQEAGLAYEAGSIVGTLPGMSKLGEALTAITRMAPAGKSFALAGDQALTDVLALSETGRYMGMPSYVRRMWADAIISGESNAAKVAMVHGWLDNAITMAGVRSLPEGEALAKEFLQRSKHAYGANDEMILNGQKMHVGLFLNQQADEIVMPNIAELITAARAAHLTRYLDSLDVGVVEGFMTKVWKPAVLLRLAFIPRAGGEEFLNFMLRGGFGGLVQEFGARSIGQFRTFESALAKRAMDPLAVLTKGEEAALLKGSMSAVPTHMRPVVHMAARVGWGDPMLHVMQRYGNWSRAALESGFGVESKITDGIFNTIAGVSRANAAGMTGGARRLNMAGQVDQLLLGNPYSWRRMVLGGVADDKIEAAEQFYVHHASSVMREVSASNAGPVDPAYDRRNTVKVMVDDSKAPNGLRAVEMNVMKGTRAMTRTGDPFFTKAVHHNIVSAADDVLSRVAMDEMLRIAPTGMAPEFIHELAQPIRALRNDESRDLINEFLDEFDADTWDSTLLKMSAKNPELAQALKFRSRSMTDVTYDDMLAGVQDWWKDLTRAGDIDVSRAREVMKELQMARPSITKLEGLDDNARAWAAARLDHAKNSGSTFFADLDRQIAGNAQVRTISTEPLEGAELVDEIPDVEPVNALYSSWGEAEPAIRARISSALTDPNLNAEVQHSVRTLTGNELQDVRSATVVLHQLDTVTSSAVGRGLTYEHLLNVAVDKNLITANETLLRQLFDAMNADPTRGRALADRALADEITRASADLLGIPADQVGKPLRVRVAKDIVNRDSPELYAISREGGEPQAWEWPDEGQGHPMPGAYDLPDADAQAALDEWTEQVVTRLRQLYTKGTRQTLRAKVRPGELLPDGTQADPTPLLQRMDPDGVWRGVQPDEEITRKQIFHDDQGRQVEFGDLNYFDQGQTAVDEAGEMMWSAVGRTFRDATDDMRGGGHMIPQGSVTVKSGQIEPSGDTVRVFRSKEEHILRVGADLPNFAIGEVLTYRARSTWQRFVQYGFDRVIGPSIDAIVRQPMAFHFFSQRYSQAKAAQRFLLGDRLVNEVNRVGATAWARSGGKSIDTSKLATNARALAVENGAKEAARWKDADALAWLRGHTETELQDVLQGVATRTAGLSEAEAVAARKAAISIATQDPKLVLAALPSQATIDDFIPYVESLLPPNALTTEGLNLAKVQDKIKAHPVLSQLEDTDWEKVITAAGIRRHIAETAGAHAAEQAIKDIVPFLDSHEFKTQFAEWGKGMLPFWYAEENFMKRWARTLVDQGPAVVRKAQLGYMGLKSAGVVRTDENGRDWFVYPGSGALIDVVSRLSPTVGTMAGAMMFQTPTDSMFPGMSERFGAPSFTPLVTMPLDIISTIFPELQPAERSLVGDYASSQGALNALIPSTVRNLYEALAGDETSSTKYSSAMMSAIAQMEATGNGLPDNATSGQIDEYLDRAREHARVILVAQSLAGFVVPGPPSAINTYDTGFMGIGVDDPAQVLQTGYLEMIRMFGIEQGTINYLATYKDATVADIVNLTPYTQGRTQSVSGAPILQSDQALEWYDTNTDYLHEFTNAAPWLVPQSDDRVGRSQYAHDQAVSNGLRKRRSPEEFLRSMKFKQAAGEYFQTRTTYLDEIARLSQAGDTEGAKALKTEMEYTQTMYRAAHPIFAEELSSSDGRERRGRILTEMRTIVADPQAPASPTLEPMRVVVNTYDTFKTQLAILSDDRSAKGRAEVEFLKQQYESWMNDYVIGHPEVGSFWTSVIRPEASLN